MKPPKEITVECPMCNKETAHEVLGGRVEGRKRIVLKASGKCMQCGHVHTIELVEERPIDVPIIVSWMGDSRRSTIGLQPTDEINVGEELYLDGERLIVTSIESSDVRRSSAEANEITTIWAKQYDKVKVNISIDHRGKVISKELFAIPEEEFAVGAIMKIDGREVVITSIRTDARTIKKGVAAARDIVRIYAKGIRV